VNTVRMCAAQQYYKRLPMLAGLAKNKVPPFLATVE